MIVTIIAIALTAIYCFVYFAPLLDYLTSEYFMALRISPRIAKEDLKKSMPDFVSLFSTINNTIGVVIIALKIFGVNIGNLIGAIIIFAIASVLFFVSIIGNLYGNVKEMLRVILAIVLVIAVCVV